MRSSTKQKSKAEKGKKTGTKPRVKKEDVENS